MDDSGAPGRPRCRIAHALPGCRREAGAGRRAIGKKNCRFENEILGMSNTTQANQPIIVDVCESDYTTHEIIFQVKVFLPPELIARFIADQARLRTFRRLIARLLTPSIIAFFNGPSPTDSN
jgi:hypothetical protein